MLLIKVVLFAAVSILLNYMHGCV